MFNPPFYATVGNRLHNSSTLLPAEHSSGQTLQKKWMVNQRQPRTPFTVTKDTIQQYNSSAASALADFRAFFSCVLYLLFAAYDPT